MRGLRGILAGSLALITLHTLVAYQGPSQRLRELAGPDGIAVRFVENFLSPNRPAIADRDAAATPTATAMVSTRVPGLGFLPVAGDTRVPAYPSPAPR